MTKKYLAALGAALAVCLATAFRSPADDAPKVNFKDNVLPIFQAKCNGCHNNDKKKGGLALDTYGATMEGGGSGTVVEAGAPEDSRLFLVANHDEEPVMPPGAAKIPDADLATIKKWIELGAPEAAGSSVAAKSKPKMEFKLDPAAIGKPQGEPALPQGIPTEPAVVASRPNAILALAASPWAPLIAVAGHKQVLLYHSENQRLLGVLPFPEGNIHCLRFSRDGGILLAAGGRAANKGLAVAFDVKTGQRLFEVGSEYDVVLAADISPDRGLVALGGPSRVLRVFRSADGEIAYECRKHTEWVTAVAFSPDGVLLASGDRNGGLLVWEADTGREFYDLRGHSAAITGANWRLDSNVLASSSEDGSLRLWEMQNGNQIKSWNAHGGAEWISFAKDGRIISIGRDRVARLWDPNGAAQREFEGFPDVGLRAVFSFDDSAVVAGDWSGEVRIWKTADGARIGNLSANPPPLAARIELAQQNYSQAQATADAAAKELADSQAATQAAAAKMAEAQKALDDANKLLADKSAALKTAEEAAAKAPDDAAKAEASKQVEALRAEVQAATEAANARKADLDARTADKAAIDKTAADKAPPAQAAAEKAAALKAEVDRLAAEKQASDAARQAAAPPAPPAS